MTIYRTKAELEAAQRRDELEERRVAALERLADAQTRTGAPKGSGRTVDDVRSAGEAMREPDGTGPTEQAVAEALGVTPEWVSRLCRASGGYKKVVPARK